VYASSKEAFDIKLDGFQTILSRNDKLSLSMELVYCPFSSWVNNSEVRTFAFIELYSPILFSEVICKCIYLSMHMLNCLFAKTEFSQYAGIRCMHKLHGICNLKREK
jgi:hypothetical protein